MTEQQQRLLIAGLVGEIYRQAYISNATFYASINTLARMLPLWVDGLAAHAAKVDADIQKQIDVLMSAPGPRPVQ